MDEKGTKEIKLVADLLFTKEQIEEFVDTLQLHLDRKAKEFIYSAGKIEIVD